MPTLRDPRERTVKPPNARMTPLTRKREWLVEVRRPRNHKQTTVRLPEDLADDAEAVAPGQRHQRQRPDHRRPQSQDRTGPPRRRLHQPRQAAPRTRPKGCWNASPSDPQRHAGPILLAGRTSLPCPIASIRPRENQFAPPPVVTTGRGGPFVEWLPNVRKVQGTLTVKTLAAQGISAARPGRLEHPTS
jgi:hypothetical protein